MMKVSYRMTEKDRRNFPHILRHQSDDERVNVMITDKRLWHVYKLLIMFGRISEYRRHHANRI